MDLKIRSIFHLRGNTIPKTEKSPKSLQLFILNSLVLGLGFVFLIEVLFLLHSLTQMLSCRCLRKTAGPETVIIRKISFLFENFMPQFLPFNFLLWVYTLHSFPQHRSHWDTYRNPFIRLSSCPSRFSLPCWGAEQRMQDAEPRWPTRALALLLTGPSCWVGRNKWNDACIYGSCPYKVLYRHLIIITNSVLE